MWTLQTWKLLCIQPCDKVCDSNEKNASELGPWWWKTLSFPRRLCLQRHIILLMLSQLLTSNKGETESDLWYFTLLYLFIYLFIAVFIYLSCYESHDLLEHQALKYNFHILTKYNNNSAGVFDVMKTRFVILLIKYWFGFPC